MPADILPPTWIPLGTAAIAAIDACAQAFRTDQRTLPADQADARLWGPWAGTDFDDHDEEV